MSKISQILSNNSYYITNKTLVKKTGPIAAMILTHLVDLYKYLEDKGSLQSDGGFTCSVEWIEENLNIGLKARRSAFKTLQDLNLIRIQRKGIPAAFHYYLNEDEILVLFETKRADVNHDVKPKPLEDTTEDFVEVSPKQQNTPSSAPKPAFFDVLRDWQKYRSSVNPDASPADFFAGRNLPLSSLTETQIRILKAGK